MAGHRCTCSPHFPYLGNGCTDCAEIWCVLRGPLAMHFTQNGGYLHGRTGLSPKGILLVLTMCKSDISAKYYIYFHLFPAWIGWLLLIISETSWHAATFYFLIILPCVPMAKALPALPCDKIFLSTRDSCPHFMSFRTVTCSWPYWLHGWFWH